LRLLVLDRGVETVDGELSLRQDHVHIDQPEDDSHQKTDAASDKEMRSAAAFRRGQLAGLYDSKMANPLADPAWIERFWKLVALADESRGSSGTRCRWA
jgi:hypothetical protein